jgi:manganese transport protein
VFAVALLAAGLASAATATLAGQIVIEGFTNFRISVFVRRAITVIPALVLIASGLDAYQALIFSQVALSIQLPFAIVPLIWLTSRKSVMGSFVNARQTTIAASVAATAIIGLNVALLGQLAVDALR